MIQRVKPGEQSINVLQAIRAFHVARECYVASRICFENGLGVPAAILADQSLGTYIKGIMEAKGDPRALTYHNLVGLPASRKEDIPAFLISADLRLIGINVGAPSRAMNGNGMLIESR